MNDSRPLPGTVPSESSADSALDSKSSASSALDRLVNREEVLQICYWYQGEGLGDTYSASLLKPFLNQHAQAIARALDELAQQGDLEPVPFPAAAGYRFTPAGKKKAGRLFHESFADFQKAGHGECEAGCCDGDDHSQCGDDCTLH